MEKSITEEESGTRLDQWVSANTPLGSRTQAAKLIKISAILVNGKPSKPSYKCALGDIILFPEAVQPNEDSEDQIVPYDLPLDILHEDDDVIVINKPAGLVMHPAAGHYHDTLVNALVHHCKDLSMGTGEKRPGIVHRLDKDTSGVLVIAKNNRAHEHLSKQFKERTTERKYWAVLFGHVKFPAKKIESFLIRHPNDRKKFCSEQLNTSGAPKGRKAITNIRLIQLMASGLCLVECQLDTGRTHQIRIHTSEMGHSIVADPIYGSPNRVKNLKSVALRKQISQLERVALHAHSLAFSHPTTEKIMTFKSPWPEELFFLWDGQLPEKK